MDHRSNVYYMNRQSIVVDESRNIRQDYGDIQSLARSIAAAGVRVPVEVYTIPGEEVVHLNDGFRRIRAYDYAKEKLGADLGPIPCIVEEKGGNEETRILTMINTGSDSKPLEPIEKAEAVKRLVDLGWKVEAVAERTGMSKASVYQLLKLNSAPADVRKAVKDKKISVSGAKTLAKAPQEKREKVLARPEKKVSAKQVVAEVDGVKPLSVAEIKVLISDHEIEPSEYVRGMVFGLKVAIGLEEPIKIS